MEVAGWDSSPSVAFGIDSDLYYRALYRLRIQNSPGLAWPLIGRVCNPSRCGCENISQARDRRCIYRLVDGLWQIGHLRPCAWASGGQGLLELGRHTRALACWLPLSSGPVCTSWGKECMFWRSLDSTPQGASVSVVRVSWYHFCPVWGLAVHSELLHCVCIAPCSSQSLRTERAI